MLNSIHVGINIKYIIYNRSRLRVTIEFGWQFGHCITIASGHWCDWSVRIYYAEILNSSDISRPRRLCKKKNK